MLIILCIITTCRWSAIAARLPGRTDNEIKNVWHTHLKKRLSNYEPPIKTTKKHYSSSRPPAPTTSDHHLQQQHSNFTNIQHGTAPTSPQQTSSDVSSSVTDSSTMTDTITTQDPTLMMKLENAYSAEGFVQIDERFWTEVPSFPADEVQFGSPVSSLESYMEQRGDTMMEDDRDFWYNLFMSAGELSELAEF